jgi:hypothetical protein
VVFSRYGMARFGTVLAVRKYPGEEPRYDMEYLVRGRVRIKHNVRRLLKYDT